LYCSTDTYDGESYDAKLQAEAERLREEAFQTKLQHTLQQKHLQHQAQLQILSQTTKAGIGRHANEPLTSTEHQPVAVDGLNSRSMVATLGVFKARKASVRGVQSRTCEVLSFALSYKSWLFDVRKSTALNVAAYNQAFVAIL
jgi:hypothetical protein